MTNMPTITMIFAVVILAAVNFSNIQDRLSHSLLIHLPSLLPPLSASAFSLSSVLDVLRENIEIGSNDRACTAWTREYSARKQPNVGMSHTCNEGIREPSSPNNPIVPQC